MITIYRANDGWRWRLQIGSRIMADSGEAYTRPGDALRAARHMVEFCAFGYARLPGKKKASWIVLKLGPKKQRNKRRA